MVKIVNGVIVDFGEDKNLVIPKDAKSFDERCYEDFQLHDYIESITVEEGNANYFAKSNCLMEINTSENPEYINILLGCKNSDLSFADDYAISSIGALAFSGVDIKSIALPDNLCIIYPSAFSESNLEEISFNDDLYAIGNTAFLNTKLKSIFVPKGVERIGVGAFACCKDLKTIEVDSENENYYSENNCIIKKSNKRVVACAANSTIPEGVEEIEVLTFYGMPEDSIITIPASVTKIYNTDYHFPAYIEFPVTFKAPKGSYAIEFAKENGIRYIEV